MHGSKRSGGMRTVGAIGGRKNCFSLLALAVGVAKSGCEMFACSNKVTKVIMQE